jgi:hypothetical protein
MRIRQRQAFDVRRAGVGLIQQVQVGVGTVRAIRPFVIGKKNWLFSDTPKGAKASAQLYSLVETAKANGQEPYAWLRHALERLPTAASVEDYEALLPWNCSPASPS